jgi:CRISPR-associated endonuclease/helicase Cas3
MACWRIIIDLLKEELLARAVLTAIVRHHTPFAKDCTEFALDMPHAGRHIRATLAFAPQEIGQGLKLELLLSKPTSVNQLGNLLSKTDNSFGWMAYTLIVRALRRSDQEGTARGSQHI